jgi:hypothetical protein
MCVYSIDKSSRLVLDTVQAAESGEAVSIHLFIPDPDGVFPAWKDWVVLLLSLLKLGEVFCLWRLHGLGLWYWTMAGWLHGFTAATILQLFRLGRDNPLKFTSDIITGKLPTPLHLGGMGKIVLGMPANVRRHLLWRFLLGVGTFCNAAGLFGTFIYLGKEPISVICVWVGFQILWLAA